MGFLGFFLCGLFFFLVNLQVVQYFTIVHKSTLFEEEICEIYTNLCRL